MKKLVLILIPLFAIQSLALDMTNPVSLCDRFLSETEQQACEKRVSALKPDWYLATTCGKQDDDQIFFECLELTKTGQFAPLKLDLCTMDNLVDSDRMTCIKAARTDSKEAFQQPRPAQQKTAPIRRSAMDRLPVGP